MVSCKTAGLALALAWAAPAGAQPAREHTVIIDQPDTTYTVEVKGTMDPENLAIEIENLGDAPISNPRMTVNGLYDWFDARAIAAEVTRGLRTDEEKALALWEWVLYKRFQRSPGDRSSLHPVRAMNGYGYGICGHTAAWLKCLWTAAGLRARVQELWGHTVSEAYYDGAWHMLDGNVKVFYLDRDNRTIASLAALERDPWLIERTIHSRDPWERGPDPPGRNKEFVRYLASPKDNFEEHGYDGEIEREYTMGMSLKPGETLTRWWKPVLNKYEGRDKRAEVPERYANGQLIWEPDLKRIDMKPYLREADNVTTRGVQGRGPAIQVADLQDELYTRPSRVSIPIRSPYPIVGARLWCTLLKEGNSSLDQAAIFFGSPGWGPGNLYTFRWGKGSQTVELDLDANVLRQANPFQYTLGFNLRGNAKANPPTQAGVERFRLVTDLQVSPHSLPALALGRNQVRFWTESGEPVKARITHRWREVTDRKPPEAAAAPVSPAEGAETASLAPTLKWQPVAGASDYQVMVSLRPDCRWPLSPSTHQNVGKATPEWTLPASFLNPGATYYWKVRARNPRGDIGPWSRVFRFTTAAGAR